MKKKKIDPLPLIMLNLCTQCGLCIEVCPTHTILDCSSYPCITSNNPCVGCFACEDVCPNGAIQIPFRIAWAF